MKLNYSSGPHRASPRTPAGRLCTFLIAAAAFLPLAAGCAKKPPYIPPQPPQKVVVENVEPVEEKPRMDTVKIPVKTVRLHNSIAELKRLQKNKYIERNPIQISLSADKLPPVIIIPPKSAYLDTPGIHRHYVGRRVACGIACIHDTFLVYRHPSIPVETWFNAEIIVRKNGILIVRSKIRHNRIIEELFGPEIKQDTVLQFRYDTALKCGPSVIFKDVSRPFRGHSASDTSFDTLNSDSVHTRYNYWNSQDLRKEDLAIVDTFYQNREFPIYRIPILPDTLPFERISFNTHSPDTALICEVLSNSWRSFGRSEISRAVLNRYAFRHIVAKLAGMPGVLTSTEPVIEITRGARPAISLYLLPSTTKDDKPYPTGEYKGGHLALGFTYDIKSTSMRSGMYLLLEPGVPDPIGNRKLIFTTAYSYHLTPLDDHFGFSIYGEATGSGRGFIYDQCTKYLSRHGWK